MIRITVDLIPHGDETRKQTIGLMNIWNDATGTLTQGNYKFWISKRGIPAKWKSGFITGFPRKELLVWDLIFRCLRSVIGERNVE